MQSRRDWPERKGDPLEDLREARKENRNGAHHSWENSGASHLIDNLPRPIALYIAAENSGDGNLFDQSFAEDAIVRDESETHKGLAAIKAWKAETKRKYQHTVDPLRIADQDGKFIVTNRLTGNFPGSPIELDFAFTIQGDKIVSLEIPS